MPKPRSRMHRAIQLQRYLEDEWPVRYPVNVAWSKDELDEDDPAATCTSIEDRGKEYAIILSFRHIPRIRDVGHFMMHEWTHLVLGLNHNHGDAFYLKLGEIERKFYEQGGWEKASEFHWKVKR